MVYARNLGYLKDSGNRYLFYASESYKNLIPVPRESISDKISSFV